MEILDGKKVKKEILENLKQELERIDKTLGLAVIQVGEDPASSIYIRQKEKMAKTLGYYFEHIQLDADISEEELLARIDEVNADDRIDGLLVQMPLPRHLNAKTIQNRIDADKDVDGLSDINAGKLLHNVDTLIPCTPYGIMDILSYYHIDVTGKNVVIVGRSDLVGKPLACLMLNNNATVTVCHSKTKDLRMHTKLADILVVAVGIPNFIKGSDIKEKAVVVDVGINRVDERIIGDVEYDSAAKVASYITPVPGGVGQMTVAELGKNVLKAYHLVNKNN